MLQLVQPRHRQVVRATLAPGEAVNGRLANACSTGQNWMMRARQIPERCSTTRTAHIHTKVPQSRRPSDIVDSLHGHDNQRHHLHPPQPLCNAQAFSAQTLCCWQDKRGRFECAFPPPTMREDRAAPSSGPALWWIWPSTLRYSTLARLSELTLALPRAVLAAPPLTSQSAFEARNRQKLGVRLPQSPAFADVAIASDVHVVMSPRARRNSLVWRIASV